MFHYKCSQVDKSELRFWVFNNDLIVDSPKYFQEDQIFLDSAKVIECLKQEYLKMGFVTRQKAPDSSHSMSGIQAEARNVILSQKAADLMAVLDIFKRNSADGFIGERELRKILFEYLSNAHDHYITSILASLRSSRPPDNSNFFRQFMIAEVKQAVNDLLVGNDG